jgi:hypothetical protein
MFKFIKELNMDVIYFVTHDKYNNSLAINENTKKFRLQHGLGSNWSILVLDWQPYMTEWYDVNRIIDLSLIENEVSKTKGNFGKILASGLLFGPVGAIAGSLGESHKKTTSTIYSVRFTLNDIRLAVVDLQCKNIETALRVINTIKLLKESTNKKYKKKKI